MLASLLLSVDAYVASPTLAPIAPIALAPRAVVIASAEWDQAKPLRFEVCQNKYCECPDALNATSYLVFDAATPPPALHLRLVLRLQRHRLPCICALC